MKSTKLFFSLLTFFFISTTFAQTSLGLSSPTTSTLDVVVQNENGQLSYIAWTGKKWSKWRSLESPANTNLSVQTISAESGRTEIIGVSDKGSVYHAFLKNNKLSDWQVIGLYTNSYPEIVSWGKGRFDILTTTKKGEILQTYFSNGKWSKKWKNIGGDVRENHSPSVVAQAKGKLDIFYRSKKGELKHKSWNKNAWSKWETVPGMRLSSPVVAASVTNGRLDLFTRGSKGELLYSVKALGRWGKWTAINKKGSAVNEGFVGERGKTGFVGERGSIHVHKRGEKLDIFYIERSSDLMNNLMHATQTNRGRSEWQIVTPRANPKQLPSTTSWSSNRTDISFLNGKGELQQAYFNGKKWSSFRNNEKHGVETTKIKINTKPKIVIQDKQNVSQNINSIIESYKKYDMDGDGTDEINRLSFISFEDPLQNVSKTNKLILVLVEDRLLNNITDSQYSTTDLLNRLQQYKYDLQAEGYQTLFIKANVYDGYKHQDGLSLLAIRKVLKEIDRTWNLKGVVLVGSFPEAMLVRRWIWNKADGFDFNGTTYGEGSEKRFLRIVPEIVAHRADLVLADLDGRWEEIYVKNKDLESIEALPFSSTPGNWNSLNSTNFTSTIFNKTTIPFEDFFWIEDDDYEVIRSSETLELNLKRNQRHPELANVDRNQPNPICKPDILVSRINPKHVAVVPVVNELLNSDGRPIAKDLYRAIWPSFFRQDAAIERELLIDYFDRNHDYRVGGNPKNSHRTASASYGAGLITASNFNEYLKKASPTFGDPRSYDDASLFDYVRFLRTPASLKAMSSHSNPKNSKFGDNYNVTDLESFIGGYPWRWERQLNETGPRFSYKPSLVEQGGDADLYLHRTIYENNILSDSGSSLFIHNGCEVNSPVDSASNSYSDENYGVFQNAEGILFFLNGLALATRAKVFYDKPEGFTEEIGKNKRNPFGVGWKAYFNKESQDSGLANNVAGNKRTYNWSILGDWTLRVKYDNGLGIFKLETNNLNEQDLHANEAWIGSWNFDTESNKIEGKGDFDGDGIDDILISSNWGIGLLSKKGNQWESLVVKPNNSWFGEWRYNASLNNGMDKIEAIEDFDGDGKDEILISSKWGIGMLELQGNTFRSKFAKPNGTRFGSWTYNTSSVRDNKIEGVGDFNGDNKADILVSKPYGIAILTLQDNTLNSILVKPHDTWFGQWRYKTSGNSGRDKIEAIEDFDGNGKDEILISSNWGIGMLELQGSTFRSKIAKPNGTRFGSWTYNTSSVRDNKIEGVGDFNGDGRADILVSKPYGIALLNLSGNTLDTIMEKPVGTLFGGWTYNTNNIWDNKVEKIGDFNGDGKADILMTKPYGIGILTLSEDTFNSLYIKPNNSKIDNWHLDQNNSFPIIGNFDGLDGEEIIIYK